MTTIYTTSPAEEMIFQNTEWKADQMCFNNLVTSVIYNVQLNLSIVDTIRTA